MEQNYHQTGGYTKVPNNIMRALYRFRLNGTQFRTVMFVIRMTNGWNQENRIITYKVLAKELNLDSRSVRRTIKTLIQSNVIIKQKYGRRNMWSVNQDNTTWRLLTKRNTKGTKESL